MSELRAENLAKTYKGRRVVDDFSLHVHDREVVGLLGPNGAGKTTSFYMIVGLVAADEGRVALDGETITTAPMHVRARRGIGYLPQEASVFRKLTVAQNIMAILETRRELDAAARRDRLETLLQDFQVEHLRDSRGMALSGGERRRVEIARALAADPQFILLDEPFAGVDPISVLDIQGIITSLRERGIGVLITDHSVRETLGICERAYIVSEGRVIPEIDPPDLLVRQQVRR
ncbi:MAG: LPS export ABC transporter ATP-binding protein, partial [Thiohalospira sp.]